MSSEVQRRLFGPTELAFDGSGQAITMRCAT